MYCKYCGKEITDDALFCQYCGGSLQERQKRKSNGTLLNRFQSLSKGWQITIMAYVVWFLLCLCLWLAGVWYDWFDDRDGWITEIIAVLLMPVLALFIWYYFARMKTPKSAEKNGSKRELEAYSVTSGQGVKMVGFSLKDFANQHGKMQVKTVANPTTNEVRSYCVFINEQGTETKVEYSESLGVLRPQEISERKEQLKVVQRIDGTFELVEK